LTPTTSYAVCLASVPIEQIDDVRSRRGPAPIELVASRVEHCPHDVTSIELFPLGRLLAEAIDTGQPLRNDAWHPLRAPMVVDPETVTVRAAALASAVRSARSELGGMIAEVLGADIDKVLNLYAHAGHRGDAVVSFLAAAADGPDPPGTLIPTIRLSPDAHTG
jgi:hypothetical protein